MSGAEWYRLGIGLTLSLPNLLIPPGLLVMAVVLLNLRGAENPHGSLPAVTELILLLLMPLSPAFVVAPVSQSSDFAPTSSINRDRIIPLVRR